MILHTTTRSPFSILLRRIPSSSTSWLSRVKQAMEDQCPSGSSGKYPVLSSYPNLATCIHEAMPAVESLTARSAFMVLRLIFVAAALMSFASKAVAFEIWFGPPDNVTQKATDYHKFFDDPASWAKAAKHVSTFEMAGNYLVRSPPSIVQKEVSLLKSLNIPLSVVI